MVYADSCLPGLRTNITALAVPDGCNRPDVFRPKVRKNSTSKKDQEMAPAFLARSSLIIFSLVVGAPISTNAEPVKVMDEASPDGLFTLAQTQGMNRRGDRRDTRQDCRHQEGAVGADKRNCKQQRRQTR